MAWSTLSASELTRAVTAFTSPRMASTFSRSGAICRDSRSVTSRITRRYTMKPPMPMPMSSSASSTLTTAITIKATFVVWRSPIVVPLCRPAALGAPGDVVQRPPPLVGGGSGLLDRAADSHHLVHEVVELGLDLVTDTASVFRHVKPTPNASDDGAHTSRHQYSRSLVHGSSSFRHGRSCISPAHQLRIKAHAGSHGRAGIDHGWWPDGLPRADGSTNIASATPFQSRPDGLPSASDPIG